MAQTSELADNLNSFSFDLYKEINLTNKNIFISPWSTYIALSIAYEGARIETKVEFENVLHINNRDLHKKLIEYATSLNRKSNKSYLDIANAIWIQNKFPIDTSYIRLIQDQYSADVKSVDFLYKAKVVKDINNWVSEKTNEKIKEILSQNEINDLTKIIISDAIYFIGDWEDKFDKKLTKPGLFYTIEKLKVQADFMYKVEPLRYFENDKFQFISKPYADNSKSFCIILPKNRYGIKNIEKGTDNI
jgi:serpin B